ncbi:MAG: hypothetical protein JW839_17135 [Candidatus Lokiarchaeota archaeon]|nr:hypothetical protein [Candidatus Lokiarchaeota archaeon]
MSTIPARDVDKYTRKIKSFGKNTKVLIFLIILGTFGTTLMAGSFDVVESGHVKIAVEPSGNIVGPVSGGWHFFWCNPFSAKYDFVVRTQSIQYTSLHADTLDGHVNIDLTVSYLLAQENVTEVFQTYGESYQVYISAVIQSAFRDAFASNTMRAVALENRSQIQSVCQTSIEEDFNDYFVKMVSLRVQNIALPAQFSEAQIQTQIAYENLRAANITAQINLLEANTQAEIAMIQAITQANITILQANSTAEALEIVVNQLNATGNLTTDHLLTYLYIQQLPLLAQYGNVIIISDYLATYVIDVPP